jgi:UDP-N-acetylmuramate dehydrogenase
MGEYAFDDYGAFAQEKPFDFAKHSSIGCGGKAKIAFYPRNVTELSTLLQKLQKDGIKYSVIGNLTNVLPSDTDTEQAVICTKDMNGMLLTETGVFAYAGVMSASLLRFCRQNQRAGVEFLQGIPCTLGGALFMNAGVGGRYISDVVENVLVYRDGENRLLSKSECGYSYKKSIFMQNGDVILGASLFLKIADEQEIIENERVYEKRRAHLPKGRSMGCVFKNPAGVFAGDLIERSGLKGLRIGGAYVSNQHANFIINDGTCSTKDIETLISIIKNAVFSQYGVMLEEEIRRL